MAAAAPSTGHIRKRQYQPSIASYFGRNSERQSSSSRSPLSPPLPAETQASLLNVGMRVRKSVPEGYKTHKTLGTDGLPFPLTAPPALTAPARPRMRCQSSGRELLPLCGLHKTRGWAQQEGTYVPTSSAPAAVRGGEREAEGVPDLSLSQPTIPSTPASFMSETSTTGRPVNKRSYEEEIEEDMDAFFVEIEQEEEVKEGLSAVGRRIAQPKASLRKAATDGMLVSGGGGGASGVKDDDFEDAAFLSPMDVDGR